MELLPHEVRFLMDSNVVRRIPDRTIPIGNKEYDLATTIERCPEQILLAETDLDNEDTVGLSQDIDTSSRSRGCWDVTIGGVTYHAAHDRVDYVKVWDVPADCKIEGFPQ
jgi:hypothetical protein